MLFRSGISTVEALADMTPEQLEAIEGIGPKTVEKISIAVNNYFSSLEGGEGVVTEGEEIAAEGAVESEPAEADTAEVEAVDAEAAEAVEGEATESEPVELAAAEETAEAQEAASELEATNGTATAETDAEVASEEKEKSE